MNYVNGFMINPTTQQVLFIEKQRPDFQRGKWNGIGGKIEPNELAIDAMCREFAEETGCITWREDWEHTITLEAHDFAVHFYRSFVDSFPNFRQTTDEALGLFLLSTLYQTPVLDNMHWILPLQFQTKVKFPLTIQWQH